MLPANATLTRWIERVTDIGERHRERHRSTGFGFALADRIDYLNPALWDALTQHRTFFIQRPYLQLVERCAPKNLQPRYALVLDGQTPVAAVVAQMLQLTMANVFNPLADVDPTDAQSARQAANSKRMRLKIDAMKRVRARIIACGSFHSWGTHGVAFAEERESVETWVAVAEALYRIRRADRLLGQVAFAMVKDIPTNASITVQALRRISYRPVDTEPDMVLDLNPAWRSFDDYLANLSAKYRKSAVKVDKDIRAAGLRVEHLNGLRDHRDELHALYMQVHEAADLRLITIDPNYIPALADLAGGNLRCSVVRDDARLLGFVLTLKDADTALGYYIGYDREANKSAPIYLRLLQAVVADAIDLRCARISLGRTALEPKARLGATPVPLQIWIRHRQPIVNAVARQFLKTIKPAQAPDRNPFKAAEST